MIIVVSAISLSESGGPSDKGSSIFDGLKESMVRRWAFLFPERSPRSPCLQNIRIDSDRGITKEKQAAFSRT